MTHVLKCLGLACISLLLSAQSHAAPEAAKKPLDYFDQVKITFTATDIRAVGDSDVPGDKVQGELVIFVPKVKESATGFWQNDLVRFASMSIGVGEYSFPLSGVSAAIQYIDNRPMRLVIGRRPAGRDAVLPGTQDFVLALSRQSRSRNDMMLEFSDFTFSLFGKKDVEFIAGRGEAKVEILQTEVAKDKPPVDFGFNIGGYDPDKN